MDRCRWRCGLRFLIEDLYLLFFLLEPEGSKISFIHSLLQGSLLILMMKQVCRNVVLLMVVSACSAYGDDAATTCGSGTVYDTGTGTCVVDPQLLEQLRKDALTTEKKRRAPSLPSLTVSILAITLHSHASAHSSENL